MRKTIMVVVMVIVMGFCGISYGATSDYDKAQQIASENGATVTKVVTKAKGGYKGKAGKYTVKYPKKVKKGKKVTVYMVEKNGDVIAMVCLGKVK